MTESSNKLTLFDALTFVKQAFEFEDRANRGLQLANQVRTGMDSNNLLKQLLMIGVGTTSLVAEKLREVSDEWVKEGRLNPDQAQGFVDDLMKQMRSEQVNFEDQIRRQMRNVMQDLGVPQQAEMDELRGRIDRLERQIRDLENRLWR